MTRALEAMKGRDRESARRPTGPIWWSTSTPSCKPDGLRRHARARAAAPAGTEALEGMKYGPARPACAAGPIGLTLDGFSPVGLIGPATLPHGVTQRRNAACAGRRAGIWGRGWPGPVACSTSVRIALPAHLISHLSNAPDRPWMPSPTPSRSSGSPIGRRSSSCSACCCRSSWARSIRPSWRARCRSSGAISTMPTTCPG